MDALPESERSALLHDHKIVHLERRDMEAAPGEPLGHVDFPTGALISVVVVFENGETNEVGIVGRDGFVPVEPVVGETNARRTAFCQVPGDVVRVRIEDFQRELATRRRLDDLARRSVGARLFTAEQLMACNITHTLLERCARWLLMTRDAVGDNTFPLTQEFLALMLGVRRASVSEAAGELQRAGAISYRRGLISIVEETLLRAQSCECYLLTRDAFERILAAPAENGAASGHGSRPRGNAA